MTLSALRSALASAYKPENDENMDAREARRIADTLICTRLDLDFTTLICSPDLIVDEGNVSALFDMIARVNSGEPVQYVCGKTAFFGRMFAVTQSVLIPRPDTEILLSEALSRAREMIDLRPCGQEGFSVLDLCTGSGIIAVSLKLELPGIRVSAGDISPEALKIARLNASNLGANVDFFLSDLFGSLPASAAFDMIVSNPPYVADNEFSSLDRSVRCFEPALALKGGNDGLDFYRRIAADSPAFLKPGGWLCLEIGETQGPAVSAILAANGFSDISIQKDLAGRDRVVCGRT